MTNRAAAIALGLGLTVLISAMTLAILVERELGAQVANLRVNSPIILRKESILNEGALSETRVPLAWTASAVADITSGMESSGRFAALSLSTSGYLERTPGAYENVLLIESGKELHSVLQLPGTCDANTLWIGGDVPLGGSLGRYNGERVQLLPLPNESIAKAISDARRELPAAIRCREGAQEGFPILLFVPDGDHSSDVWEELTLRAQLHASRGGGFAPVRVSVEHLADRLQAELARNYRWLHILINAFSAAVLLALCGHAVFAGSRDRHGFKIRRALGAPLPSLGATSAWKTVVPMAACAAVAVPAACAAHLALNPEAGLAGLSGTVTAIAVIALGASCAWITHMLCAAGRIDQSLSVAPKVTAGRWRRVTLSVCVAGACLVAGTLSLLVAGLAKYNDALQEFDLGYDPTNLLAYRAIPTTARARLGTEAASLIATPLMDLSRRGEVSFLCSALWEVEPGVLPFEHAAAIVPAGPGIAAMLGIDVAGRDLSDKDLFRGGGLVVQNITAESARAVRYLGSVIGSVQGVHTGGLSPVLRDLVFIPPDSSITCPETFVLARVDSSHGRHPERLRERLEDLLTDHAVRPPRRLTELIDEQRRPLDQVRKSAAVSLALVTVSMLIVVALMTTTYIESRMRVIAVRHALGESVGAAILTLSVQTLLVATLGIGLAACLWPSVFSFMRLQFPAMPALSSLEVATVLATICLVVFLSAGVAAMKSLSTARFVEALRDE